MITYNTIKKHTMPNYQNGKIYCLRSHQTDEIYIGSTTQKLSQRMGEHRGTYKKGKRCLTSHSLLCYDDCYIELLELFPCNSITELNKKEGEYMRKMNCVNKRIAGRTKKEWDKDNAEKMKICKKEHYENNKEKIKKYKKEWDSKNKEKISERSKQKKICECGSNVNIYNINRHMKTKKHNNYIKNPFYNLYI